MINLDEYTKDRIAEEDFLVRLGMVLNAAAFRRESVAFDVRVAESGTRGHTDEALHRVMVGVNP